MRCKCGAKTFEGHLRKVTRGMFGAHVFQLKVRVKESAR